MLGRSPTASRTTSQTASFTRSVAKFRLCSGERWAVASVVLTMLVMAVFEYLSPPPGRTSSASWR